MKTGLKTSAVKKTTTIIQQSKKEIAEKEIAEKAKLASDDIEKQIRLSNVYIGKLNQIAEVKIKKNLLVRKKKYEDASKEK